MIGCEVRFATRNLHLRARPAVEREHGRRPAGMGVGMASEEERRSPHSHEEERDPRRVTRQPSHSSSDNKITHGLCGGRAPPQTPPHTPPGRRAEPSRGRWPLAAFPLGPGRASVAAGEAGPILAAATKAGGRWLLPCLLLVVVW